MKHFFWIMLLALIASLALAQGFDPQVRLKEAQERAAAVRAARIDALRQLGEAIKGVRITSRTTVKDFVTESDEVNAQFEAFLQGAQQEGNPNIYDDGTVEIKMVMYVEDVVGGLKEISRKSRMTSPDQVPNIAKNYAGRKFEATGTGTMSIVPSPASGIDLWTYVTVQGRLMAKRAAQVDAYRNLGETLYGVKLDSKTTVKDFVVQNDAIQASFNGVVQGAQFEGDVVYLPDGLAQVTATVNVDNLINFLSSMSPYARKQLAPESFENLRYYFPTGVVRATGVGAPPARYIGKKPQSQSVAVKPPFNRIPEKYTPKDDIAYKDPTKDPNYKDPNWKDPTKDPNYKDPNWKDPTKDPNYKDPNWKDPTKDPNYKDPTKDPNWKDPNRPPDKPVPPELALPPAPPGIGLDPLARPALPPMPKVPERFVPEWAKRYITATGNGAYPEEMDVGQARAMARRAAQLDAYRLLAESALGVKLHSETTIKDFLAEHDQIEIRVKDTFIRGGQTVEDRDIRDQRYFEVDMKLYLGDMWEIIDAEYNVGLLGEYGKNLELCLPPAERYKNEFQGYQKKLDDYKGKAEAYRKQLEDYFTRNRSKISMDFPISRECQSKYQDYQNQIRDYDGKYQKYNGEMAQYQKEVAEYLARYKEYYDQYQKLRSSYENEAKAALMPAPPVPPYLYFFCPAAGEMPPLPKVPQRFVPEWANKHITAKGTGAYSKDMPDAQAMAMARRAAQVDAYRLLVETAMGVRLTSETTVKDFVAENDTLSARVKDAYLRGAQTEKEQDVPQDRYFEVTMKLYLGDMWEVIDAEYNKVLMEKYGKKLEEYQPDQVRYKSELELYQAQLSDYEKKSIAYYKEIQDYYAQQKKSLAADHPVAKRYGGQYEKYLKQGRELTEEAKKHRAAVDKYRQEMERRKAEYEKYQSEFGALYGKYKNEADIALIPPPPISPDLSVSIPVAGEMPPLPKVPQRFVPDWANKSIEAKGVGVYSPNMEVGQAMAMARRAAQVDAYRLLVENAMGVHLTSETSVQDFLTQNDTLTARVKESFLRGAQTVAEKDIRDRRYFEVTMKLFLGDMWEIIDAEYNKVLMEKYGKKLEEYQPDQLRFKSEMEVYKAQLATYKERQQAYQNQLSEYYAKYGSKIASLDNPIAKKHLAEYQKVKTKADGWNSEYGKYQKNLEQYQTEMARRQAEYEKSRSEFNRQHQEYRNEAEVALIPPPPPSPELSFAGPSAGGDISLPRPPQRFVPEWAKKEITAKGIGVYPKDKQEAQAMAMARRAAQVDAYRVLVESAKGVHIASDTSVKDFLTQRDKLSARVEESFLRGAQEIGAREVSEDRYYEVTMKLYLGDMWEIIDAEYNKVLMEKYGRDLAEFQPDQARFKTEMDIYRSQLQTYKTKAEAYQKQLEDYYAQYGAKISVKYPVAKKYQEEYRKSTNKAQEFMAQAQKYQKDVERYQSEKQRNIADYEKYQSEYDKQYGNYQIEAEIALIPPPPPPPALSFSGPATGQNLLPKPPERFVPDWAKKDITATGTGVYPKDKPLGQAKLLAQRAAQVDAYRLLVENAVGVHLQSQTSVENFITQKDRIKTRVDDVFLKGAQVVDTRHFTEKGYCQIDMKLYLGDMWEIIDAEYNKVLMKEYGQKLEEFQPDQARYRTEMELYQAQLRTCQNATEAYQKQLRDYYAGYGEKLSLDYPVCKKHREQYQKYLEQARVLEGQCRQYEQSLEIYEREKQRESVEFEEYQKQSRQKYEAYEKEAESEN